MLFWFLAFWFAADEPSDTIMLDRGGHRGVVAFDHALHIRAARDPHSPADPPAIAACSYCHHTRDARGVIQLLKCEGCHGPEGDSRNPKSRTFDEEYRKQAFHDLCIRCHEALGKISTPSKVAIRTGPVACVDCHAVSPRPGD